MYLSILTVKNSTELDENSFELNIENRISIYTKPILVHTIRSRISFNTDVENTRSTNRFSH